MPPWFREKSDLDWLEKRSQGPPCDLYRFRSMSVATAQYDLVTLFCWLYVIYATHKTYTKYTLVHHGYGLLFSTTDMGF